MKIVLFGPQGAGKGTLAKMLAEKYDIPHIDMGGIFRDAAEKNTATGLEAKKYWEKGNLVPNHVTIQLMKERLAEDDIKNGFVLDGYPRNIEQAQALDETTDIDYFIEFEVTKETSIQRLSGRRICEKCKAIYHITNIPPKKEGTCDKCGGKLIQRADDTPEAIKKRLEIYHSETEPIFEYYEGKMIKVSGEGTPQIIFNRVMKVIKE